jgi:hypothetical protein
MKNYIIAAVVIILIIGGIVWVRSNNVATPVDTDINATTTDVVNEVPAATSTDTGTSTVSE